MLEGPRRRDPVLDVPGAGRLHPALTRRTSSPTASGLHANTVRLHLERLREAGLVDVEPVHRGTVGRPAARLLAGAGCARPRASTRPATPCSPGCSRRSPSGSAPTAAKRPRSAASWGIEAGRRTRSRSCVKALSAEMEPPGIRPGDRDGGRRHRHRVHALPVPGARRGLPRAGVQPAPRHLARASSPRSAAEASRSSRRCTTATRAGSPFPSRYPDRSRITVWRTAMIALTDTATDQGQGADRGRGPA